MEGDSEQTLGFTTQAAITRLRDDIRQALRDYNTNNHSWWSVIGAVVSVSCERQLVSGAGYLGTAAVAAALVAAYAAGEAPQADSALLWQAALLILILIFNFSVAVHEEFLYRNEIPHRVKHVLTSLESAARQSVWEERHYPHLCAPFSPCVTLQWTYRDGRIVNLPWALLVRGDVVVLRPGQEAPGGCAPLRDPQPHQHLNFGEIYKPTGQKKESLSGPRVRAPHENKAYVLSETPYLSNLRHTLERALGRPITAFNKQRYMCTVRVLEGVVWPAMAAGAALGAAAAAPTPWPQRYLLAPATTLLPLLPLLYPAALLVLNAYGMARFKILSSGRGEVGAAQEASCEAGAPLLTGEEGSRGAGASAGEVARTVLAVLVGCEDMVTRTANIVHVLGELSALCCVDKKGILSWPNPTAEKVFLLRGADSRGSSDTSAGDCADPLSDATTSAPTLDALNQDRATVAEVLDLTHDQNAAFRVEWDDTRWLRHLPRLTPLGLAALLNTCAPAPRHTYSHFCAHLACEALLSEDLVPVTNRRCLCELAKQIGFTERATDPYTVLDSLAVFRHLQAETIKRETRFARSLQLSTRVKVPLPHMLAVLVQDRAKCTQMLTQGTADIVVDSCADYWDGRDLAPLSLADRKKILDFYQRNSLTAYCSAFAYKPVNGAGVSPRLAAQYLELPAECRALRRDAASAGDTHLFHSTDSLLINTEEEEIIDDVEGYFDLQCNQVFLGMVTMQYQAQSDMVELIERLERACVRFVHFSKENELRSRVFSEKMGLESGWNCHISLMTDDTDTHPSRPASPAAGASRVPRGRLATELVSEEHKGYTLFSSGCEAAGGGLGRALSASAPGAINLDHNTVKFNRDAGVVRAAQPTHSLTDHYDKMEAGSPEPGGETEAGAGDSPTDACRSLSCLADSTDHSAPLNFDMSNGARLPRGIDNIRGHIEQVDNVPLLVSLFTDCTPRSARHMIHIMQDYGEVVCLMGSAANASNCEIFMQADASIAVEPLYPVLCQKMPPYELPTHCPGPVDLARKLNSVPCSLSMRRESEVCLFGLIAWSRHHAASVWSATQYWMCAVCSVALVQMLSLWIWAPSALSSGGALWLGAVAVPALAAALACAPPDPAVMQRPAARSQHHLDCKVAVFVVWCYGCKFLPSVVLVLALYGATLRSLCAQTAGGCVYVYPARDGTLALADLWLKENYDQLYLAQHVVLALLTAHLIVISVCFVHRDASVWQKGFWTNRVWCATVLLLVLCQSAYSAGMLSTRWAPPPAEGEPPVSPGTLPPALVVAYCLAPLLVFALNELIKWQEIKYDVRNQRRARLDFGTKLGMNSPF